MHRCIALMHIGIGQHHLLFDGLSAGLNMHIKHLIHQRHADDRGLVVGVHTHLHGHVIPVNDKGYIHAGL